MRSDLLRAVQAFSTQSQLAERVGVTPAAVAQWISGHRRVPEGRCPSIERATDGRVTCEQMRPDVRWARLPDPAWPWHPSGRPLLDLTATTATAPVARPTEEVGDAA